MIIRNSAKCKNCGDEIESKDSHDFVMCKCKKISIDGGLSYLKRSGDPEFFEDTSIIEPSDISGGVFFNDHSMELTESKKVIAIENNLKTIGIGDVGDLIDILKDYSPNTKIKVLADIDYRDPGGYFNITNIIYDRVLDTILIGFDDD